ncbi:MAG: pyridoxine 5'-phosphate synthase [Bacteriovoracaceae bacterium]|nr:pyridoxine 5'-phosphate synthase [Bacteriovoracaceae bacterium]
MMPRLGINIDHVATLRQARGEGYPSVVEAADVSLRAGADQITIHLREDRRHIQDMDVDAVRLVTMKYGKPLNLEMGCNEEITDIACATGPEWVCLVPENRQERTTEGGLDLISDENFERVKATCERLQAEGIKISLFLESDLETLKRAALLKPKAIEIHTGEYARKFTAGEDISNFIEDYKVARDFLVSEKIGCHAGHGLSIESVMPLVENKLFEEYNIGHWIVCRAVFDGLGNVIKRFKEIFDQG